MAKRTWGLFSPGLIPGLFYPEPIQRETPIFRSEIDDFRVTTMYFLLPVISIAGFVWGLARGYTPYFHQLWPPFAIFILAFLALLVKKFNLRFTRLLLVGSLCWVFLTAAELWNQPILAFWILPIVAFAGFMLETSGTLVFMLLVTLIIAVNTYTPAWDAWVSFLLEGPLPASWAIWLIVRLGIYPYINALRAARADREWAMRHYDSGKDYQSQLRNALRRLEQANYQIVRQNKALEQARFEAEQGRKAKNEFTAIVSHELLTPINLIAGYSEMICKSPNAYGGQPLPMAYRADVWAIYHSAQHLRSLITDVLDLSCLDTGKTASNKEVIDSRELLNQVVEIAHDLVTQKSLELKIETPLESCPILADIKRIRQVWLNLIKNAVRFTEAGSISLIIRKQNEHGEVVHIVQDTGVGILEEDIARLFQPFEQLSNPLNRVHEGTGLGLALCKKIIEEHEGKIWVESQVGSGSQFFFSIKEFSPSVQEMTGS